MSEPGVRVCAAGDVVDGEGYRVDRSVTGTPDDIAVLRDGDELYALDDTCTHALASLSEGWVEDGAVECPLHSGRFDLATGKALCLPLTRDTVAHRVEVRGDDVYVTPTLPGDPNG